MNYEICEIAKEAIEDFGFIHKLGGLVSVAVDGDFRYPVYCADKDCQDNKMIPDSKLLSVIYFEEAQAPRVVKHQSGRMHLESRVRLIGWLNNRKLGKVDCSISHEASLPIIKALNGLKPVHQRPLSNVRFAFESELEANYNLFAQYNYDEKVNYLLPPYDCFGLVFKATWTVSDDCIDEFELNAPIEC